MTRPGEGSSEPTSGILRAVGSLLVALSGGDDAAARRLLGDLQQSEAARAGDPGFGRSSYEYRPEPPRMPERPRAGEEIEFVLSDARQRAQRILDESMERARELVRRERLSVQAAVPGIDPGAFDDLRRAIYGLVTEVRDIQQRLARIESLLAGGRGPGGAPPTTPMPEPRYQPSSYEPPAYQRPERPSFDAPRYQPAAPQAEPYREARYEPPSPAPEPPRSESQPEQRYAEPQHPETRHPEARHPEAREYEARDYATDRAAGQPEAQPRTQWEQASAPGMPEAHAPSPAPAPPRTPFSVVPPDRRDWVEEPSDRGELPPAAVPRARSSGGPLPQAWQPPAEAAGPAPGAAPIATFLPADGGIVLRVTPVAGFQGLMRVQDALARLPVVRQAAVEAYSQGEARLRIELADTTDSEELAAGLGRALREPAHVREASESERQLLIALR